MRHGPARPQKRRDESRVADAAFWTMMPKCFEAAIRCFCCRHDNHSRISLQRAPTGREIAPNARQSAECRLKTSDHGARFGCYGEPVEVCQTTVDLSDANLGSVWNQPRPTGPVVVEEIGNFQDLANFDRVPHSLIEPRPLGPIAGEEVGNFQDLANFDQVPHLQQVPSFRKSPTSIGRPIRGRSGSTWRWIPAV